MNSIGFLTKISTRPNTIGQLSPGHIHQPFDVQRPQLMQGRQRFFDIRPCRILRQESPQTYFQLFPFGQLLNRPLWMILRDQRSVGCGGPPTLGTKNPQQTLIGLADIEPGVQLSKECSKNSFLNMQTVFCLVKYHRMRPF